MKLVKLGMRVMARKLRLWCLLVQHYKLLGYVRVLHSCYVCIFRLCSLSSGNQGRLLKGLWLKWRHSWFTCKNSLHELAVMAEKGCYRLECLHGYDVGVKKSHAERPNYAVDGICLTMYRARSFWITHIISIVPFASRWSLRQETTVPYNLTGHK